MHKHPIARSLPLLGAVASLAFLLAEPAARGTPLLPQAAAQQQQLKLAKGAWWGAVGDRVEVEFKEQMSTRKFTGTVTKLDLDKGIVTIQGELGGKNVTRPMFATEILSMKTLGAANATAPEAKPGDSKPAETKPADSKPLAPSETRPANTQAAGATGSKGTKTPKPGGDAALELATGKPSGKVDAQGYQLDDKGYRISPKKGVFVLPWKDAVGQTARAFEINQMAKEADKWGPGQIIIMDIDSPGGLVSEIFKISDTLREVRKRHRVVAWIREAISAAAVTSMHCDEIYFRRGGALGAAMMIRGADSVKDESLYMFINEIGKVVEENGRPRMVFEAMVLAAPILTYTKDPVTGKPTYHDHITGEPGEVVLSNEKDNLVFNASNALDCGFSAGTADTPEELGKLLGLTEWYEVSDYGRKIAKAWQDLFKACDEDVDLQGQRWSIPRAGGTIEQLSQQVRIFEKVLQWAKRCPPCTESKGIDPEELERQLIQFRKRLAEMRKAQNSGTN